MWQPEENRFYKRIEFLFLLKRAFNLKAYLGWGWQMEVREGTCRWGRLNE